MKNLKKILALVMVVAMMAALGITASAATITVTGAAAGKTYTAYKVFDATWADADNDGVVDDGEAVSYTINSNTNLWWSTIVGSTTADENTGVYTIDAYGMTLTPVAGVANTYVVDMKNATAAQTKALAAALDAAKDGKTVAGTASGSGTSAATTITVADTGYYFVDSTNGILCSLLTSNQNITAVEKNNVPTPEKTVSTNNRTSYANASSANIGDVENFKVTITYHDGDKNWVLHDTMSTGLTYNDDMVAFVDTDKDGVQDEGETVLTLGEASGSATINKSIPLNGLNNNDVVCILYSATVNSSAAVYDDQTNSFKLSYDDVYGTNHETVPTETLTHVYGFNVSKIDGSTKNNTTPTALQGVKFTLTRVNGTTTEYYKGIDSSNPKASVWTTTKTELTTNETGDIDFKGLAAGTYTLTETATKAGYNLLTAPVTVVIADNGAVTFDGKAANNVVTEDGKTTAAEYDLVVENYKGSSLPSTGGMGTTIFYVIGGILVLGAGVLLITKKRMAANG